MESTNINTRINIKLIIFFLLLSVGFIVISFITISKKTDALKEERYIEVSKLMKNELKTHIAEKKETILNITLSLAENKTFKESLLDNGHTNIDLKKFSLKLSKNTSLKNVWFQILTPDGISFYRSWTNKRGDDLKKARIDIAKMVKEPKTTTTISTGKFDLTFKAMVPIYHDNTFIGIFETIAKFNSVAIKMADKGYDTVIAVDKRYKQQLTKAFSKTFINDYYIANTNAKKTFVDIIKSKKVEHFLQYNGKYHIHEDSNMLINLYSLPDIHGKDMAYFIMFHNLDNINMSDIVQMRDYLIILFSTIFLIVLALAYYFYIKRYKNFMEKLNIELEEKVNDKTKTLKHQAHYDSLTALPNRLLFSDRLAQSIKHASRHKTTLSLLFLDLDRFKEVNDSLGHEVGDKLLQIVSIRLKACIREEDTIARQGGDEFTILLGDIETNDLIKLANKLISTIQEPFRINHHELYVTLSIGISNFPEDGTSSNVLLRNADTAMYKTKELGKNGYQFYNSMMTEQTLERLELDRNIRKAIERHEFQAYYQPQVDLLHKKVVGMETLIRWHHPELGTISPVQFIPLAEETGLIIPIDQWMMQESVKTLSKWQEEGIDTGKLSINLSIKQLENKDFITHLKSLLDKTGCDPKKLEFEITESQIMKNPESSITVLNHVKELGITIAIDDFGTGYSSLSYLKRLPIDKLKIDRSFIKDLPSDEEDATIVRTIIALAKSLKLDLIAEGVETQEQKEFLIKEGCHKIQGYLYSKPIPEDEYKAFLLNQDIN